jgi:hypothetical protein
MSISRTQKAEGLGNLTIANLQPEKFPVTAVQLFFGTCQLESPPPISFCVKSPIWKWLLQDLYQLHQPYYLRDLRNL